MDQQFAVSAGRDGNPSIESDGRRHDETIVIVRMLSDQIDASRRTIDLRPGAKKLMKFFPQIRCSNVAHAFSSLLSEMRTQRFERWSSRRPNVIMIKPKPSITKPHQKLTLIPSDT